jgi:hypothetical protein
MSVYGIDRDSKRRQTQQSGPNANPSWYTETPSVVTSIPVPNASAICSIPLEYIVAETDIQRRDRFEATVYLQSQRDMDQWMMGRVVG